MFSNTIAICGGAHLRFLRAFDKKVLDLATQSLAPDSGLRAVHAQELPQADRKIWSELAALRAEGWSLDEALHEGTKVRSDLRALLQPRAKPIALQGKGGKSMGKKGKDGKGKLGVVPTISKIPNDPPQQQPSRTLLPSTATKSFAFASTNSSAPTSSASTHTYAP